MRERAFGAFVELLSGKLSLKTLTYNVNFMFNVEYILATVMTQMDLPARKRQHEIYHKQFFLAKKETRIKLLLLYYLTKTTR